MTRNEKKGSTSYAGALLICQNLGELTAYELAGDRNLIPDDDGDTPSLALSLVLMPGVQLASDEMLRGIATLGTSALGVRCLLKPNRERIPDFTVLFAENGTAERFASMRPWFDPERGLYLVPDEDRVGGNTMYFRFDCGLRKATQPWVDEADRHRGVAEATALLLAKAADSRPS